MNRCDVVIVNFNAGEFLTAAVESVLRSRSVAHVYIVDNVSIDGSLDLLPRGCDARLSVIRNTANIGFAAACNLGFLRAASETSLCSTPSVMDDAVDRLLAALRSADRVGMEGPLLLNTDGSEQAGGRRKLPKPSLVLAWATGGAAGPAPSLPILRFLAASRSASGPPCRGRGNFRRLHDGAPRGDHGYKAAR